MKKFRDFESAREFARALNLKGSKEWKEYCKSGKKPDDIPRNANIVYKKEFKGYGNWLGTEWRSFKDAREFVRSLGLKNYGEWAEYCKSGNKPDDIPVGVRYTYKNDFKGMGDWLGTGRVAAKDKIFRPFNESRNYVRNLKLKNSAEWITYCKSGNKPDDVPANPNGTYKKDFKGIPDWLGIGNTREFKSFTEAREFVRSLELKSNKAWRVYLKSGDKPDNIPSAPERTYKNEWKEWGDFLGTGRTRDFRPYKEAREFVQKLGLKSTNDWWEYCKSGDKPDNIPSHPNRIYKNEWNGYGDFLGTGNTRDYKSFTEAREFVRSLGLKNLKEWNKYCTSNDMPNYIPSHPNGTYKKDFKGYGDWLGTGNISNRDKVYRPFKEAREFVQKLGLNSKTEWLEYCKSGNKPDDIPSTPWDVYKEWKKK